MKTNMKRQLGKMEQGILFVDELAALFIVVVLRLVNGPPPEVLQRALAMLQKRHPLLRVQIGQESSRFYFQIPEQVPPIPLQISERQDDRQWQADAEAEVNLKLDPTTAPLMRVRYIYSAGQDAPSEIIFTCHHTIMDAASGVSFCHELLSLCGTMCAGQPAKELEPLPLMPPAEALYPPAFQGARRLWRTATFLLRQMADEVAYRRRLGDCRRPPVHPTVHTRFLPVQLDPDATARFIRRTRRERVTLNSGLVAAELLAVRKHLYQNQAMPMRAIAFANLRPHLKPPVPPENLGAYFAMLQYTVQVDEQQDLWELAREIQQKIYRITKRGDKFVTPLLTKALFQMMSKQTEFRMGAAGVSYSSTAGLGQSYGPIRLVGLHGLFPNNNLGPEYGIFARLLFDRLWLDVFFVEEDMDRHTAQTITDEICRMIEVTPLLVEEKHHLIGDAE
jgi:hypothetical protein